jgi:formylglycine-generating enzyme required for sulfatase activity
VDLSGNVWEWTRSLWGRESGKPDFAYPYDPTDKRREHFTAPDDVYRVLRGGAFWDIQWAARCAYRFRDDPALGLDLVGFRVVVLPKL